MTNLIKHKPSSDPLLQGNKQENKCPRNTSPSKTILKSDTIYLIASF